MERIKKINWLHAALLILLSGILWTCTDERIDTIPTIQNKGNSVTFSIKLPSASTPKNTGPTTYALSENDENKVQHIAVLLFDSDDNYTHQPIYVSGNNIITNPTDSRIKTFTIEIPEGTYNMVVLANSYQSLNSVLGSIVVGQPKAEVLNKLLLSNSGKWNATSGASNYIHIPMWGEVANISIATNMTTPITLVRMVAKIDVALTTTTVKNNFNLESVRLYNYNDRGHIVPDMSKWDSSQNIAIAPTIPTDAVKHTSPLVYNGTTITQESGRGIACTNEIYTFEAFFGSSTTLPTNTCLIVGGKYNEDSEVTYYRIDFANTIAGVTTFLPILRNHNYKVNISDITGAGFSTPEQAFNSKPLNIEANIINWDDTQITQIVYNGQYMLGVSKEEFTFLREAQTYDNELLVTTDYPSGWKVDKIVDASNNRVDWLSITPENGVAGGTTSTKLTLTENTSGEIRTAFIHLSAGSLSYIVTVNQLIISQLGIFITDTADSPISLLEFISVKDVQPDRQQFKLNWFPATLPLRYNTNVTSDAVFTFDTSGGNVSIPTNGILPAGSGPKTYSIRPPSITTAQLGTNPFYERNSVILYSITDGTSNIIKAMSLRQYIPTILPIVEPVYRMDGGQKTFSVRSNTPFIVTVKTDPNNIISQLSTTGEVNKSAQGTPVTFKIIDDMPFANLIQKNVVVTISSPGNLFEDVDVTLNCKSYNTLAESNSYILAPNDFGIMIPVSRANKSMLGNQLSQGQAFTASLVWTDNSNKIAPNSNIKLIGVKGTGPTGYLLVVPGSAQGNALVAVKNAAGDKILWSWHIWVTAETPTVQGAKNLMDRNLGAIGKTPGEVGTKGLMYQWGRKDPFPNSTAVVGNDEPTLYNASGTTNITKSATTIPSNFGNSVANPTFYYEGVQDKNYESDWYSSTSGNHNNNLWGPNTKTVYDPCPVGWRVPNSSVWGGLNNTNFKWVNNDYGRTNNDYGGYYPATGYRDSSGALLQVGTKGHYWSSDVNDNKMGKNIEFTSGSTSIITKGNYRDVGFSVRCVKE